MIRNIIFLFLTCSFVTPTYARTQISETPPENMESWNQFDDYMVRVEEDNRRMAWSYIISGSLVTLGGLIGSNSTDDSALQLVLGLSTTTGLAGVGYGIIRLHNGTPYSSLFETLKRSQLSDQQRSAFLQDYIRTEHEKLRYRNRVKMISHLVAAGLNLYSASSVSDQNSKSVLHVFAALNVAFAFSYTF